MAALFAATIALVTGCNNEDGTDGSGEKPAVPTIELKNGNIDLPQEITESMSVKVDIEIPGAVKNFEIKIESPYLTDAVLHDLDLAAEMNLVQPANDDMAKALARLGFKVGPDAKDAKTLSFDISACVPMIAENYSKTSDHKLHLTVTDGANQTVTKTLWLHLTGLTSISYNNDADLWANTASLTVQVGVVTSNVKVEYRRKDATTWQQAAVSPNLDGSFMAAIAPVWNDAGVHASGEKLYVPQAETGIFAGAAYEYRVLIDDLVVDGADGEFPTVAEPQIPGGDMETWKETEAQGFTGPVTLYAPTDSEGNAFWGNGCNAYTPTLCMPEVLTDQTKAVKLQGSAMGTIFAAGNLFTGIFEMAGLAGYARFGEVYTFSARPRALRVRYKASISTITMLNPFEDFVLPEGVAVGVVDPARIMVCVTDWSARHSVHSGFNVAASDINAFDPEKTLTTEEGEVLAYGSKTIVESVDDWTELTIPLLWKDKIAKPATGTVDTPRYSLVISTAANAYGDYLCGCLENELHLDAFEWVY